MSDSRSRTRICRPGPEHAEALSGLLDAPPRGAEVACVVEDGAGTVVAASMTETADVELVGGERFALYETVPPQLPPEQADALLATTFRTLDDAFDPEDLDGPIGLCLLVADRREMKRRPEALWADPPMHYVGFLDDGRLVRVAYFTGAVLRGTA